MIAARIKSRRIIRACCLSLILFCAAVSAAEAGSAEAASANNPNPIADTRARPGGRIRVFSGGTPKSLNYFLDNNSFTAQVFGLMFESLLGSNPLSGDHAPGLARGWEVSDDGKTFTFEIDPDARWNDGAPVTARDVCWTFEKVTSPESLAGVYKMILEPFEPPIALDERRVRFTARDAHWRNLGAAGGLPILPEHAYGQLDFNRLNFEFPVMSGPYSLGRHRENISLEMERRGDWWAGERTENLNTLNFQIIEFRFFAERENAFEAFRKGELDLFPVYTARLWMQETRGERFDRSWIVKQEVRNRKPVGFQGFAMNLRREPYNDVRVRRALAHLLDREKLNRTLMYNLYFLHRSYFEDLYDAAHPCENPDYNFDKKRARELLAEAGWLPNPGSGWIEKDGKPLVIRFLNRDQTADRFLSVYREDLRDAGIQLQTERKDLAAWFKDMDEFNFDMTWAAWGSGLYKDPESQWHSKESARSGGNNITGFANARVDELIEMQRTEFDVEKRHDICRRIDRILTEECPYILLWNTSSTRLLYWNKFGMPKSVLSKYGSEDSALAYWWFDPDSADDLMDAMKIKRSLPRRPDPMQYDKFFTE